MLKRMNASTVITCFLSAVMLCSTAAAAGLYKGVDEEGNVIYSDKPFKNSEQFTPPAITVMDAPKVRPKKEVPEKPAAPEETRYRTLSIVAPKNQQTIWNEPNVVVKAKISPALNQKQGHRLWLIMDGKPRVKKSRSTTFSLGRLDRGEHKVLIQVRNSKGKVIRRSKTVTFYIQQTSVKQRSPR